MNRLSSPPSFSNWIGLSAEADLAPDGASPPASAWDPHRQQQQQQQCAVDVADILSNYTAAPGGCGFRGAGPPASPLDRLLAKLDRDRPAAMMFSTGADWQLGGGEPAGST